MLKVEYIYAMIIFLGPMTFGCVLCYPSPTAKAIQQQHSLGSDSLLWSFYNSVSSLTAISGPFLTNFILKWQSNSRKRTMFILSLGGIVFWVLNCLTKLNIWVGIVIRAFLGVIMGAFSSIDPMYLVEIAPEGTSGFFGSLNQIGIVIGIILFDFLGPSLSYIALNFVGAGIDLLLALTIWYIPDYIKSKETSDDMVDDQTIESPLSSDNKSSSNNQPKESLFQCKYMPRLFTGIGMMFFQQFSGINAILTNLASIMDSAGLKIDGNYQAGIATTSMLIAVVISSLIVDKFGRKMVLGLSCIMVDIFLIIFGLNDNFNWSKVLPLICVFAYQLGFGLGMGPIPWFIIPEYFNSDVRPLATTLVSSSNWVFSFLIIFIWPSLKSGFGFFGAIIFFATITFIQLLFIIFIVRDPEQQDR